MTRRLAAAALALVVAAPVLVACDGPTEQVGAIALVLGNHRNGPVPGPVGDLDEVLGASISRGDDLYVFGVTGTPKLVAKQSLKCPYSTTTACDQERRRLQDGLPNTLGKFPATDPESDLLGALNLASDTVRGAGGQQRIFVVDSGLGTAGNLCLVNLSVLDGDLTALAGDLAARGLVRSLKGISVTFAGVGQVAGQQSLPDPYPGRLRELWVAVARAAGATDVALDTAALATVPRDESALPAVALAARPKAQPGQNLCEGAKLTETQLGFLPGSPGFRDRAAALAEVRLIADALKRTGLNVILTGTTAYAEKDPSNPLSNARAQAVKGLLADQGVDPAKILTQGVGIDHPDYVDPRGDPVKERLMRMVLIQPTCPRGTQETL